MKNFYRHYRQVQVSYRGGEKPEVQGYEEIWRNGQRQVRHWTDEDDLIPLPIDASEMFDFWNDPWMEVDQRSPVPRYLKPIKVEVEEPVTRKFVLGEELSKVKQFFTKGWKKVQRMSQRLPSALKAAWRELNYAD